jgi:hypothetical protein
MNSMNLGVLGAVTAAAAGLAAYMAFSSPSKPARLVSKREPKSERKAAAARPIKKEATSARAQPSSAEDEDVKLVNVLTRGARVKEARAQAINISVISNDADQDVKHTPARVGVKHESATLMHSIQAGRPPPYSPMSVVSQASSADAQDLPPEWAAVLANLIPRFPGRTLDEIVATVQHFNGHGGEASKLLRHGRVPTYITLPFRCTSGR